ncbi:MAG: glycosyltransferase [bacterium]
MARSRPLTVLDITKWYGETSGGVRTYLDEKRRYVRARTGLRHILVIPGDRDEMTDDGNTRSYRLRGPRIPRQRQYRFLLAPRTLRAIIEREQPDVIEVGSPIFVPWITKLATRGHRIPLVGFYHTDIRAALAPIFGRFSAWTAGSYIRRLDRLFAATLVASDASESELRAAGASRLTRVSLGVDLGMFHPRLRAAAADTRTLLDLPLDAPLVTYLGRIAPEKRLDVAIDAWPHVERSTRATLVMMGDGPLRATLAARSAHMRVRWLPFDADRSRVAQLLAASDLYLSPGESETFGLSAVEAMACGTRVISADRGGGAEHVRRSSGGFLFEGGNARALGDQIVRALHESPDESASNARRYVERHHDWDAVFDRIFDTYRGVVSA